MRISINFINLKIYDHESFLTINRYQYFHLFALHFFRALQVYNIYMLSIKKISCDKQRTENKSIEHMSSRNKHRLEHEGLLVARMATGKVECMWFNIVFYKNFKKVFKLIFFNIFRLF